MTPTASPITSDLLTLIFDGVNYDADFNTLIPDTGIFLDQCTTLTQDIPDVEYSICQFVYEGSVIVGFYGPVLELPLIEEFFRVNPMSLECCGTIYLVQDEDTEEELREEEEEDGANLTVIIPVICVCVVLLVCMCLAFFIMRNKEEKEPLELAPEDITPEGYGAEEYDEENLMKGGTTGGADLTSGMEFGGGEIEMEKREPMTTDAVDGERKETLDEKEGGLEGLHASTAPEKRGPGEQNLRKGTESEGLYLNTGD